MSVFPILVVLATLSPPQCHGTHELRGVHDKRALAASHGIRDYWNYELDHYIPLCLGGADSESNLRFQPWPEARRDHVHRDQGLGLPVMIIKAWYKLLRQRYSALRGGHAMIKITSLPTVAGALLGCGLSAAPAQAGPNGTWVSGKGTDRGGCPVTAPCRTFAFALTQTAAGGEIDVLDPADYGPVTITKSISIVNDGVGVAAIRASSGNAITINAGAGDSVHLRGLTTCARQVLRGRHGRRGALGERLPIPIRRARDHQVKNPRMSRLRGKSENRQCEKFLHDLSPPLDAGRDRKHWANACPYRSGGP
jgi:hypothetical protein